MKTKNLLLKKVLVLFLITFLAPILLMAQNKKPVKVIYETNMCATVDDVGALAMLHGLQNNYDLEELELAYAPPYSSAKDPVNVAGFVAANILKGDMDHIQWGELPGLDRKANILIDLRNKKELEDFF